MSVTSITAPAAQLTELAKTPDQITIGEVRAFLLTSGLSWREFAEQIGYSYTAFKTYMRGGYAMHKNNGRAITTELIRNACRKYIAENTHTQAVRFRGEHFETADFLTIRKAGITALMNGQAYVVDGPPGTQKSRSFRELQREIAEKQLGHAIYLYIGQGMTPRQFLVELCTVAAIPSSGTTAQLMRKAQYFLGGRPTLLLLDEGNHASVALLETIRQLLDMPPYFGVLIGGSHDLANRMQQWEMEQWRRRNQKTILLTGPTREEARDILAATLQVKQTKGQDNIITKCIATATRLNAKGKPERFEYISAGRLFDFIHGVQAAKAQKEQVAA